jgi:hypothetical protein
MSAPRTSSLCLLLLSLWSPSPSAAGAAQPTVWASGKVVDETGRPVPGAHVELVPVQGDWFTPTPANPVRYRATSGPDGWFRIPEVPADSWFSLGISQKGFTVLLESDILTPANGGQIALGTFRLPEGPTVAGKVVDSKGHPLAGARVWARSRQDSQIGDFPPDGGPAAVTGADGRFEIHRFELGELEVCWQDLSVQLTPEPSARNRIVLRPLPPSSRISGRVIDDRGLPVAGAKVHLKSTDPWALLKTLAQEWRPCSRRNPGGELITLSDREGRFTFELTGSETMNVWAEAAGFLEQEKSTVAHSPQNPGRVELVLERGAIVSGRVLTAGGLPAAGAEISISSGGNRDTQPALADGKGRYRLIGVEPGEQTVAIRHPSGQTLRKLAVAPGENRRPDLVLDGDELREIRGRVTGPDGEPVVDVSVRIAYPAALQGLEYGRATAPDGSFLLSFRHGLLGGGGIGFEIAKPEYRKRLVRLDPAEAFPAPLEVRLDPGLRLAGHVLGFDAESPRGMSVEARQGEDLFTSRVSRDGEYRFASLTPGDWVVTTEGSWRTCGAARVTLEPGTKEAVLDLQIPPEVEVEGKVFAPDGTPVDGVRLTFRSLDKEAPACASVFEMTTSYEGDGSFSTELPEGRFTVLATVEGYAPTLQATPLTIAARPVKDLEVYLNPGSSLRGRLLGLRSEEADAASVKATNGSVSQETKAAADGTYRLDGLGPGDWSVSAGFGLEGSSRRLQTRIKLEPGQTEAVRDLDLLGKRSFAVRFASGDEPVLVSMRLSRSDSRGELVNTAILMNADRYLFNRLPAGGYRLHIDDDGHHRKLERAIDLTSDQEITIDLLKPDDP